MQPFQNYCCLHLIFCHLLQCWNLKSGHLVGKGSYKLLLPTTPVVLPSITKHFGRAGYMYVKSCFNDSFVQKRKLPGTPLLLVVPSGPTTSISSGTSSKRARFWHNHLSVLGKVVPVTMHTSNGGSGVSISQCLDHIIGAVRIKVLEVRKVYWQLLGWIQQSFYRPHS